MSHLGSSFFGCEKSIFFKSWLPQCRWLPFWEDHGTEQFSMTILDEHDLYVRFFISRLYFSAKKHLRLSICWSKEDVVLHGIQKIQQRNDKHSKTFEKMVQFMWRPSGDPSLRCFGTSVMSWIFSATRTRHGAGDHLDDPLSIVTIPQTKQRGNIPEKWLAMEWKAILLPFGAKGCIFKGDLC